MTSGPGSTAHLLKLKTLEISMRGASTTIISWVRLASGSVYESVVEAWTVG